MLQLVATLLHSGGKDSTCSVPMMQRLRLTPMVDATGLAQLKVSQICWLSHTQLLQTECRHLIH